MPLPFEPPLAGAAKRREGFEYWWRQIFYAFDLPDPRLATPLEDPLSAEGLATVSRFIQTSRDLAASAVVSIEVGGFTVKIDDETGEEHVVADFPRRDLQVGFATLLRQCHGQNDEARYDVVFEILRRAVEASSDAGQDERRRELFDWNSAVKTLRKKSLDQSIRDRFVAEEGWKVWDYEEEASPEELIRVFNYGDLIHGGTHATK